MSFNPGLKIGDIVEWLSRGGHDTLDNTVALCPNCHRKMYVLDLKVDKEKLKAICRGDEQCPVY